MLTLELSVETCQALLAAVKLRLLRLGREDRWHGAGHGVCLDGVVQKCRPPEVDRRLPGAGASRDGVSRSVGLQSCRAGVRGVILRSGVEAE
jgi:hypothetical protein